MGGMKTNFLVISYEVGQTSKTHLTIGNIEKTGMHVNTHFKTQIKIQIQA